MEIYKKPMTISELLYDCMIAIFRNFTLNELEDLRRVSKQFEEIAIRCWKLKTKQWKRQSYYGGKKEEFNWHVLNLFDLMEELDLDYLSVDEFKLLSNYQFPNIVDLKTITDSDKIEISDLTDIEKMKIIVSCFPNLQKLSIFGKNIDVKQIITLTNLTELELSFQKSNNKTIVRFKDIFTKLKLRKLSIGYKECDTIDYCKDDFNEIVHCSTLVEILMSGALLALIAPNLPQLPHLKAITCLTSSKFQQKSNKLALFVITNDPRMRTRIKTVTLDQDLEWQDFVCETSMWASIAMIQSLEVIVVDTQAFFSEIQFPGNLDNLREFHFKEYNNFRSMKSYNRNALVVNLREIISKAPNLNILGIRQRWYDDGIPLAWLTNVIRTEGRPRRHPLQLQLMLDEPIIGLLEDHIEYDDVLQIKFVEYVNSLGRSAKHKTNDFHLTLT